jgi:hypothetical protein
VRWLAVAIVLGCGHPDVSVARDARAIAPSPPVVDAAPADAKGSAMALAIKLLASPTALTMKQRATFKAGVEVTNTSGTTIETHLSTGCALTVNGQPSMSWNLAIGNGTREPSWDNLPPGKTVSMSWPLGESLFPKPGDYHLVMTLGDQQATADIKVSK